MSAGGSMIRRKKHRAATRYSVSRGEPVPREASAATSPYGRPQQPTDRNADSSRSYESAYSITSGYPADRIIILP
jgi:hypothetical protein